MTPLQERFVQEYLIDLNGPRAAARAGYAAGDCARRAAHRNLRLPYVRRAIAAAKAMRAHRTELSADRVLAEYAAIAFANLGDYCSFGPDGLVLRDMATLTPPQTAAVAEVTESKTQHGGTVRFKLYDKLAALNALARHIGLGAGERSADMPDTSRDELQPVDLYEIARRIAFALRQGENAAGSGMEPREHIMNKKPTS